MDEIGFFGFGRWDCATASCDWREEIFCFKGSNSEFGEVGGEAGKVDVEVVFTLAVNNSIWAISTFIVSSWFFRIKFNSSFDEDEVDPAIW